MVGKTGSQSSTKRRVPVFSGLRVTYLVSGADVSVVIEKLLHHQCTSCPAAEMQSGPAIVVCAVNGYRLKQLRDLHYIPS